jgi:hypothetical protein
MADLRKYSVNESNNIGLGQAGCLFEDGTTAISGKKIVAIQFIADSTFTTLTPEDSSYVGTAGGNGDAIDSSNCFYISKWFSYSILRVSLC